MNLKNLIKSAFGFYAFASPSQQPYNRIELHDDFERFYSSLDLDGAMLMKNDKLTPTDFDRVELIGPEGRQTVVYGVKVNVSVQDKGKTLKVFYDYGQGGQGDS